MDDCEAVATAPFSIRMAPKELAAIKAKAKRLNMSANAFFRFGAELALALTDRELVRFAAARAAEAKQASGPDAPVTITASG